MKKKGKISITNPLSGGKEDIKLTFNIKHDTSGQGSVKLGAGVEIPQNLITMGPQLGLQLFSMWKMMGGVQSLLNTVHQQYDDIAAEIKDPQMHQFIASQAQTVTKDDIKDMFDIKNMQSQLQLGLSFGELSAEQEAKLTKAYHSTSNDNQILAMNKFIADLLPTRLSALYKEARTLPGKSFEDSVLESVNNTRTMTVDELADLIAYKKEQDIANDALSTAAAEMLNKATPQSLKTLTDEFTKAVSKTKVDNIIFAGLKVAESTLTQLANAQFSSFSLSQEIKDLGNELKDVLQSAEDAFVKAGMTPDSDVLKAMKKHYALKKAPAGYKRPAPKNGKGGKNLGLGQTF